MSLTHKTVEFCTLLPPDHALAGQKTVPLSALAKENFIFYAEGARMVQLLVDACNKAGFTPKIAGRSAHMEFILELVSQGLGVAVVPHEIHTRLNYGNVAVVPLPVDDVRCTISIVWRKAHKLSHAANAWLALSRGQA
ncbi:MAG: LysR substrate-binding domain-containing protein [Terricaulis sp.]